MSILHSGSTVAFTDEANREAADQPEIAAYIRFHGNAYGGLIVRAYPSAEDGLIQLSRDDVCALRDLLNEIVAKGPQS